MTTTGYLHVILGMTALGLGGVIYGVRKGTRLHRAMGYGFVVSIIGLHGTAFTMYRAFGGFGLFHVLSVINLATLAAGFIPVYRKKPAERWLRNHYTCTGWTYAGLLAATAAEVTRLPIFEFRSAVWWAVWGIASFCIGLGALYLVYRYREQTLRRVQVGYDGRRIS